MLLLHSSLLVFLSFRRSTRSRFMKTWVTLIMILCLRWREFEDRSISVLAHHSVGCFRETDPTGCRAPLSHLEGVTYR